MSMTTPTRARRALLVRTGAALLTLVVGVVTVACSAPTKSSTDTATSVTSTTAVVDPGTGPTSITRSLRTTEVASGFAEPTSMVSRPMRNQLWIAERAGRLRVVQLDADWSRETAQTTRAGYRTQPFPVLDISGDVSTDGDRGLLGIAFSTDGRTVFLDYVNRRGEIIVASWTVTDPAPPPVTTVPAAPSSSSSSSPSTTTTRPSTTSTTTERTLLPAPQVDERSKRVMLTIPHDGTSNYGGQLALGRDGFLYIGVGDSTKGSTERAAQDTDALVGKVLRIDPGGATFADSYAIPPSNPYVKGGGAAPVFMIGVQNPLRFSFDRSNGDLWLGDAGAGRTQEIDMLPSAFGGGRGANLGWPYVEGSNSPATDAPSNLVAPILAFDAGADRCPVIGGYVYRGSAITDLQGVYIYGDRCSGTVSGLLQRRGRVLDRKALGPQVPDGTLTSFGQDDQGELYVLLSSGVLARLVA